jgi:hypothetical protein
MDKSNEIYKNDGMAIYIKGQMVIGVHPDNLINNLFHLSEGNLKLDWGIIAKNSGIELDKFPKNVISGAINLNKIGK